MVPGAPLDMEYASNGVCPAPLGQSSGDPDNSVSNALLKQIT